MEVHEELGCGFLEETQVINYLKATGMKVGLLINLGYESIEYKRLVYNS